MLCKKLPTKCEFWRYIFSSLLITAFTLSNLFGDFFKSIFEPYENYY